MNLDLYLAFVAAAAVLIIMPGPIVTLVVANSVTYGTRSALSTVAGAQSGHFLLLLVVAAGMTSLMHLMAEGFEWLRWVGVAYLVWLGLQRWRAGPAAEVDPAGLAVSGRRLFWQGFYRTMASGTRHFAVAVCRVSQNDVFARQDPTLTDPYGNPGALMDDLAGTGSITTRFPVPWRVTVARRPGSQILTMPNIASANAATALGKLAPRGSKMLIHTRSYANTGGGVLDFPGGRILTVVDTDGRNSVQILEDMSDIQAYDPSGDGFRFDVWVFPPHVTGGAFSNEPPVLEWKVSL